MIEETLAEVDSAPAPEVTATSENAEIQTPEVVEVPKKEYSQEELNDIFNQHFHKRLAREQRKWEREQQAKQAEAQVRSRPPADVPPVDQFETPEAYAEALAEKRAQELVSQRDSAKRNAEIIEAYADKEEEVRGKYDDFDQVAYNPQLRITDVMAETIRTSDLGPELAYHLGTNPKEAERISKLTPYMQAKEIGRIEAKLADAPPVKKTSSAPAPISPVSARNSSNKGIVDTTDPRAARTMSDSEWIEADRRREMAKMQALRNR